MKRLLTTKKAQDLTQWLLNSQRYYHHGSPGSGSPFTSTPTLAIGLESIRLSFYLHRHLRNIGNLQTSSSFYGCSYTTTSSRPDNTELHSRLNGQEENENTIKKMDLQIISRENIKPASPTPDHLRAFNLSIFDQFFINCHTPFVLFLPNTENSTVTDVITKRSKHLKDSLSELLTAYYPFAGEFKDHLHIDCNDKGVYFVEARVNQTLEEFLIQPDDLKVRELIPEHPNEIESSSPNYVVSVQVNIFNCGGIALSTKMSHKLIDAHTFFTFMKAWAATARGSPEKITPSFVASEIFPSSISLKYSLPSKLLSSKPFVTKRFAFDSTTISTLKNQLVASHGPTRTEAAGALIWKAAAKAASTVRRFSPQSPHALFSIVNLRKRTSCLPNDTIGNLILSGVGICFPYSQPDLPTLLSQIRESIAKINPELVEALKGENEQHQTVLDGLLKSLNDLYDVMDEGDGLVFTSILNSGIYQIDFGYWGKPIWFYHINPGFSRIAVLNDTIKGGGGVEAIVTLSPEEMKIFEHDPEILSYTSVNPSPLKFLN